MCMNMSVPTCFKTPVWNGNRAKCPFPCASHFLLTVAALSAAHYNPYTGVKRFGETASNTASYKAFLRGISPYHGEDFVIWAQQVCWWNWCACVHVCARELHSNAGKRNKRSRQRQRKQSWNHAHILFYNCCCTKVVSLYLHADVVVCWECLCTLQNTETLKDRYEDPGSIKPRYSVVVSRQHFTDLTQCLV